MLDHNTDTGQNSLYRLCFAFELCGLILLTAIIGGVGLCHLHVNAAVMSKFKYHDAKEADASQRLKLIDMDPET